MWSRIHSVRGTVAGTKDIFFKNLQKKWGCRHVISTGPLTVEGDRSIAITGLPRHRENKEFESPFVQTGKTQGISQECGRLALHKVVLESM